MMHGGPGPCLPPPGGRLSGADVVFISDGHGGGGYTGGYYTGGNCAANGGSGAIDEGAFWNRPMSGQSTPTMPPFSSTTEGWPSRRASVIDRTVDDLRGVSSLHGLNSSHCLMSPMGNSLPCGGGAAMMALPGAPPQGPWPCAGLTHPHHLASAQHWQQFPYGPEGLSGPPCGPLPSHFGLGSFVPPPIGVLPCRPLPADGRPPLAGEASPRPPPALHSAPSARRAPPAMAPAPAPPPRVGLCNGFKDSSSYLASPACTPRTQLDLSDDAGSPGGGIPSRASLLTSSSSLYAQQALPPGKRRHSKIEASCMKYMVPCLVSC